MRELKISFSEKLRNICIGLGAMSGLVLGLVATFKGEPGAELAQRKADKTWETLRLQVNEQTTFINRLHRRLIFLQAHEEGRLSAEIQLKLNILQKQYDDLLKKQYPSKKKKILQSKPHQLPLLKKSPPLFELKEKLLPLLPKKLDDAQQMQKGL